MEDLYYRIFDPTGNITALVMSEVEAERQPAAAAALMRRFPELEQVGFLRFPEGEPPELRRAGGEFCANASMCAAALYALRCGTDPETVRLRVSGARSEVLVRLRKETDDSFSAAVRMPGKPELFETEYDDGLLRGPLPGLRMEGVTHLIVGEASPLYALLREPARAAKAVRTLCAALGAKCLGLMFLGGGPSFTLTPLVFVPESGTLFWENSCASGSAAVGAYLAAQAGRAVRLELREPGGTLEVESAPDGETWIRGRARLIG